ncbi:hypothetical protein [Xylanibacter oryzae]|nr:hypothetical protein [Xylanibacter oryzae]
MRDTQSNHCPTAYPTLPDSREPLSDNAILGQWIAMIQINRVPSTMTG